MTSPGLLPYAHQKKTPCARMFNAHKPQGDQAEARSYGPENMTDGEWFDRRVSVFNRLGPFAAGRVVEKHVWSNAPDEWKLAYVKALCEECLFSPGQAAKYVNEQFNRLRSSRNMKDKKLKKKNVQLQLIVDDDDEKAQLMTKKQKKNAPMAAKAKKASSKKENNKSPSLPPLIRLLSFNSLPSFHPCPPLRTQARKPPATPRGAPGPIASSNSK